MGFIGMQKKRSYSWVMFQLQGFILREHLQGNFSVPSQEEMIRERNKEVAQFAKVKNIFDVIDMQSDYFNHLAELSGARSIDAREMLYGWAKDKQDSIITFRE